MGFQQLLSLMLVWVVLSCTRTDTSSGLLWLQGGFLQSHRRDWAGLGWALGQFWDGLRAGLVSGLGWALWVSFGL